MSGQEGGGSSWLGGECLAARGSPLLTPGSPSPRKAAGAWPEQIPQECNIIPGIRSLRERRVYRALKVRDGRRGVLAEEG